MSNSALLLHSLIMEWNVPSGTRSEQVRFNGDPSSIDFWRSQARAAQLLADVERSLDGMQADGQEVEHFRDLLPTLYQAVFSYTVAWQSAANGSRAIIDPRDLKLLRALGGQLEMVNTALPISGEDLTDLLMYLDEVEGLVRGSSDISSEVRRYLLSLIVEAQRVAREYETFGDVELRSVTMELGAALLGTAESEVPEERRAGWVDGAKKMVRKAGVSVGMKMLDRAGDAAADGTADAIGGAFSGFLGS